MTVTFGEHIKAELYGTSHGPCIGVHVEGLPEGMRIDTDVLQAFLDRRAPGRNAWSTPRKEADRPVFLSGVRQDPEKSGILFTTGGRLTAEIRNTNVRPGDYANTSIIPRPGHADYPAWVKYGKIETGGGQFSARLTAALCIAGGIFLQWLGEQGIRIGAHVYSIGPIKDTPYDPMAETPAQIRSEFPVIDPQKGEEMKALIAAAKEEGDSVGGRVECVICGLPAGMGSPLFGSIESRLCQAIFTVPAVKGIEFGEGFAVAEMKGSENNDPYVICEGTAAGGQDGPQASVVTQTNHHGGILGGLSSGMPILLRAAMKPTPSIARAQQSVDLASMTQVSLEIKGRHDPCIVPRAVPCIEAAAALAIADVILENQDIKKQAVENQTLENQNPENQNPEVDDLTVCRVGIDRIDRQIIRLLEERFDVVTRIGEYKRKKNLPVLDAGREQEKLDALGRLCTEGERTYIEEILKKIMEQSRHYQCDQTLRYGLLGKTLGHSHSPEIHKLLGGYDYELFERQPEELEDFFAEPVWRGINVTIPYKREVMKFCDELSDRARACNSVNTIVRRPAADGTWTVCGDNTDYAGFRYVVDQSGIDVKGAKTLVLGSGGVSGTVVQVLKDLGAVPLIISRTGENNYSNLDRHADAQIIVNTTPVGMYPKAGQTVIDVRDFPQCRAVYDLIYNPLRTRLMLDAEEAGIPAFGGLLMLVAQAAEGARLFLEASRPEEETNRPEAEANGAAGETVELKAGVDTCYRQLRRELENIALIGMPGAGKTTVGRILAYRTGRPLVDLDEEVTARTGRTPETIIREDGVDEFRNIETRTLEQVVREGKSGMIIACGGGIVERDENRGLLKENSRVVWLKRPLKDLPTDGRPVSQADGLEKIYARRKDRYQAWSDLTIEGEGIKEKADRIMEETDR